MAGVALLLTTFTSHTAEYPRGNKWSIWVQSCRARSDQDSVRAAGIASSLIRNTGSKRFGGIGAYKANGSSGADCMFLIVEGAYAVMEDCAFHTGWNTENVPEGIANALVCMK
eukprot:1145049-Pelagomonas_calceolata.AAC.2